MPEAPIKSQIKRIVERQRLDDAQLEALHKLTGGTPQPRLTRRRFLYALSSAAALAGVGFLVGHTLSRDPVTAEQIAHEVLMNHIRLKPLNVHTDSMQEVRRYFTQLDFMPLTSRVFPHERLQMQGGRYCSLQSVTATQLVFKNERNETVTFYQTAYIPEVFGTLPDVSAGQQPIVFIEHGFEIHIWVEGGVLMAYAQPLSA